MVGQLLKLGTVLYLVSIPLGIVIGASSVIVRNLVIIGSGTFVALYSCAGGISAVVYTDVVQVGGPQRRAASRPQMYSSIDSRQCLSG